MLKQLLSFLFLLPLAARAQDIDVQHYVFNLQLSDSTDRIYGDALLDIRFPGANKSFTIDLVGKKGNGKGMTVQQFNGYNVESWKQEEDKIVVQLKDGIDANNTYHFQVKYSGIPADGLIISKNKHGERTFFADNWPNRAHHWIPCNDRPDDKASFEFRVKVPPQYTVISNGLAQADPQSVDPDKYYGARHFYYKEETPLSTKVMVIGAARFAIKTFDDSPAGIPVSAWVYPQDSTKGFYDYAVAPSILKYFSEYIAPFPYSKLANVQSKTIFGGMENASCIFYAEESVTGDRKWEDVIAHEIAHQWFGDMASEKSFAHLWLSEGFATYFTNLYIGQKYGADSMRKRLYADRKKISDFAGANPKRAVVDSTTELMSLLNANSYDKGGWVLHMLRQQVGDKIFQQIIQRYYATYRGGNADTRDFQRVADSVYSAEVPRAKQDISMEEFFAQWLYRPGIPNIAFEPKSVDSRGTTYTIRQEGPLYSFPVEVQVTFDNGQKETRTFWIKDRVTDLFLGSFRNANSVQLDPNCKLLHRGSRGASGTYWRPKRSSGF
ncbi:MAG: M1 family peptidase [Chitinophagaceae bacterium]|nr:MAG: M1 family peptidase [Chitinophagaceae bacterium]